MQFYIELNVNEIRYKDPKRLDTEKSVNKFYAKMFYIRGVFKIFFRDGGTKF